MRTDGATFRRYDDRVLPTCIIATGHDDEAACRALSRSSGDDEAANGGGARGRRLRRGRARPAHVRRYVAARACAASASAGGNSAKRKTAPFRTTRISAPCSLLCCFGRLVGWLVGWVGAEIYLPQTPSRSRAPRLLRNNPRVRRPRLRAAATSRSTCTAGGACRCGRARRRWLGLTVRSRGMARLGSKPGPVAPEGRRGTAHPRRRGG